MIKITPKRSTAGRSKNFECGAKSAGSASIDINVEVKYSISNLYESDYSVIEVFMKPL